MNWKIPMFKIFWDREDLKSISGVVKSGMRWAEGPAIEEFEDKIAGYVGSRHCVSFNSGTSALHAILLAYGIGKGDEVIVPSFTFISTANAPLFVGAKPIFADIEEETLGLDPEDVKRKITLNTKAIIAVHYAGCPCKIRELKKIADEHKLILIEDTAESLGARIGHKKVGTFGDAAALSFCQNKIITTGEGGGITTNSKKIYTSLKLIRSHGRSEKEDYFLSTRVLDYVTLGYNFRIPSLIAALGISQLKKIHRIIEMRRKNAQHFSKMLSNEAKKIILPLAPKDYFHVYQMYTIRVKKYRDELMRYLESKGIMTKIYFYPVHLTSFYRKKIRSQHRLPVTERISKEVLTLPMYPTITKNEIDYIVKEIKNFFRRAG